MCVFMHEAEADRTIGYFGVKWWRNRTLKHVLGYQMRVQNLHLSGPNAMILHIPSDGVLNQSNFLDTRSCKSILNDMAAAIRPLTRGGIAKGLSFDGPVVNVFQHDIYDVVSTNNAALIPQVLRSGLISPNRIPDLNPVLFDWYAREMPQYNFAILCFDNRDAQIASPLLVQYDPLWPEVMRFPGLDWHKGGMPDFRGSVEVDHTILLNVDGMRGGHRVNYSDRIPSDVMEYLPETVIGRTYSGRMANGDFVYNSRYVEAGKMDGEAFSRSMPN